ncbi:MAG TPA: hypothetical protein VIG64_05395 [Actinomycetota bacterium]|jgi:Ca2+-binding RTX toxin-like protein
MGDQTIWGDSGRDKLKGGMGADTMFGGDGADRMRGEDQADELNGNSGDDVIDVGDIATARGGDFGYGGIGDDTLKATGTDDDEGGPTELYGNVGADRLFGTIKHELYGGPGNDRLEGGRAYYTESSKAVTVDLERGRATGEGRDELVKVRVVVGTEFGDVIRGSDADDFLYGGEGGDDLDGRAGDDVLSGGPGTDSCANGETEDTCES